MDSDERRAKQISEDFRAYQTLRDLSIPVAKDKANYLELLDRNAYQNYMYDARNIYTDSKKTFANKTVLGHITNLNTLAYDNLELALKAVFAVDYLYRKVGILEEALVSLNKKINDLPTKEKLKEVETVHNELANMGEILQKIQGHLTQHKKASSSVESQDRGQGTEYVT